MSTGTIDGLSLDFRGLTPGMKGLVVRLPTNYGPMNENGQVDWSGWMLSSTESFAQGDSPDTVPIRWGLGHPAHRPMQDGMIAGPIGNQIGILGLDLTGVAVGRIAVAAVITRPDRRIPGPRFAVAGYYDGNGFPLA